MTRFLGARPFSMETPFCKLLKGHSMLGVLEGKIRNLQVFFYKKLRIWASTESFLKLSDFQ